ncbi:hypothetical protein V2J09_004917 [Rumex salicifolius]
MAIITLQKKRNSRKGKKTQNTSYNEDHQVSFLSKFFTQIPATLIFLFLIFLWSTSTTLISGSIVHVCFTSRKLTNSHHFCLSAGAQPSNDSFTFANNPVKNKVVGEHENEKIIEVYHSAPQQASNKTEGKAKEGDEAVNKEVERQMQILRSYKMRKSVDYSDPDACDGKGIFVYDLPSKFNKDLMAQCSEMVSWMDFCKFLSNGGFGETVSQLGNGWYNTHQFALEPIFHARVLKHPCRVHDPENAKLFYVPFYGGLDIMKSHFIAKTSNEIKDKLSKELINWLGQQKSWNRNFGLDHVFVLGKVSWDFRRGKNASWGNRFLEEDDMQNPMKLLIERHPWHGNDVAVPYPTSFHPRSDNDIVAWQTKIMQIPRKNLASFIGTQQPNAAKSIESNVMKQCTSAATKCKILNGSEPGPTTGLLTSSEFCLHPSGEGATSKWFFESLVAGCIPVVFDPFTAHYQYPWHLPVDRSNYSFFVDRNAVLEGRVNVVDRLEAVNAAQREEMRRYVVYEVMPGLVYAHPEGKFVRFEDAFSVAMNSLLLRMSKLP